MNTITIDVKELDQAIFVALVSYLGARDDREKLKVCMAATDKIMVPFHAMADKQAHPTGATPATTPAPLMQAVPAERPKRQTKKEKLAAAIAANTQQGTLLPPSVRPLSNADIPQFGPSTVAPQPAAAQPLQPAPFGATSQPERI